MTRPRPLLLLPFAFVLAACGSGDKYQPQKASKKLEPAALAAGQEATVMPFKVGNQWVYTVELGAQKSEVTVKVTKVENVDGGTVATLTTSAAGQEARDSQWRYDSTGLYQVSERTGRNYDPPQLLVPFPLELYGSRTMKSNGPLPVGTSAPFDLVVKYVGPQEVDTDMGRMSALAVESVTSWTGEGGPGRSIAVTWWKPDVGFVRQRQEISTQQGSAVIVMKLKSYSFT